MSYSICGLIIPQPEERTCSERGWPFVTLKGGVSLIPLARDYLFLAEGDETEPPTWLSDMGSCFSRAAYVEAEFWGGTGMQASVVLEHSRILSGPVISSGAINYALRYLGVDDQSSVTFLGVPAPTGRDPFDMAGLGRHRSVGGWAGERRTSRRTEWRPGGAAW
jgi:hypothetical protein